MSNSEKVLQEALVELLDLGLITKQAHWNVKGVHFMPVHLELDDIYEGLVEAQDTVAERLAQIGGEPDGTSQTIAKTTPIAPLPTNGAIKSEVVIEEFTKKLKDLSNSLIAKTAEAEGDQVTQDIFGAIVAQIDKHQWFIRSQKE
jgi:starvation-inducible DNA-binding protein